jgi:hypothetical protein
MAEVERELEQSTVQRARSLRALPTPSYLPKSTARSSMGTTSSTDIALLPSITDKSKLTAAGARIGGTKRAFSPERGLGSTATAHNDEHRRLSSSGNGIQNAEVKSSVPPTHPR